MGPSRAAALLGLALLFAAARPVAAQVVIEKVSPSFRPGPYSAIAADPDNPDRVAVATEDGHLIWSDQGGRLAQESTVISERRMDPMALRGGASRRNIAMRTPDTTRRAILLFLANLRQGNPPARWSFWMGLSDPVTILTDIALPPGEGPVLTAGPGGVFVSDEGRSVWSRPLGGPGVMTRDADLSGLSVAINPFDPAHVLAGTSEGLMVSRDGGATFHPHPDPKSAGDIALQIAFDPAQPGLVFAVTPDTILVSDDGGETFSPGLSVEGEIRSLSLSPEAAYLATSDGLQVVLPDQVEHYLEGKDLVGAVGWGSGFVLAASEEALYVVAPDGAERAVLRTHASDPYLALAGGPGNVWLLSRTDIRRIRYGTGSRGRPRPGYEPPELLLSQEEIVPSVLENTGLGDPEDTRLHERWYAKLVPTIVFQMNGWYQLEKQLMRDGTFPIRFRHASAQQRYEQEWSVFAVWDLSRFVFGDRGDVANAHLILESNLRANRKEIMNEVRWRYREAAELISQMQNPPPDPETELLWNLRLEEHASYLKFLAGREVVDMEGTR